MAQTVKLLENLRCEEKDIDRELAEVVVNHVQIPYFRIESDERLLTDILGIETRKVCTNIYRVEKVINSQISYVAPGDFVIAPRKITKNFGQRDIQIKDKLYVLKVQDGTPELLKKMVEVNLRAEKRWRLDRNHWRYVKIEDFSHFEVIDVETADILVIDLRCNRGGKIIEMKSVYERIYGSKIKLFQNMKKGFIDFRSDTAIEKRKTYLIVDKTTCSSAELFAGMGQTFEGAVLVGTKMYGKNMICKRKLIDDMIVHIPEKKFLINGKSTLEIIPDYRVDNVCEYNEEEILTLCQQLDQ